MAKMKCWTLFLLIGISVWGLAASQSDELVTGEEELEDLLALEDEDSRYTNEDSLTHSLSRGTVRYGDRTQQRQGKSAAQIERFPARLPAASAPAPPQSDYLPPNSASASLSAAPAENYNGPPASSLQVNDIRCMKMATKERFSATIHIPNALGVNMAPIFEDRPAIEPQSSRVCSITAFASSSGVSTAWKLDVSNLDACGVTTCTQDAQPWLCLTLRFPTLPGLKLPEDEIILLRCKPQDRTIAEKKDLDFRDIAGSHALARVEQRSPLTFTGGKQEFLCEIGLFRKLPGTTLFSQRITAGTAVELGEEVQLRSIVRSNDGWFYSKLTDVVIRKIRKGVPAGKDKDSAILAFNDGCRNSIFKTIAPQHPQRDVRSFLLHHFNFRVFMFQDMQDGDSILISAKVMACVEAIDCAPSLCSDDRGEGYGRRRRSVSNSSDINSLDDMTGRTREISIDEIFYPNGTSSKQKLRGWEADMAIRVTSPGAELLSTPLPLVDSNCVMFVISSVGFATALGVTLIALVVYCFLNHQRSKRNHKHSPELAPPSSHLAPIAETVPPPAPPTSALDFEKLVQVVYPEFTMIDALTRSLRFKKERMHDELLEFYNTTDNSAPNSNHYCSLPATVNNTSENPNKPKTLKQVKRQGQQFNRCRCTTSSTTSLVNNVSKPLPPTPTNGEQVYWEINNSKATQIWPPTPV